MRPKTDQNRCQKRSRKKMVLKIVLEPSWADLGSSWVPSWGQNRAVAAAALIFSKIDVLEEKWCQDACWDDLGSIWVAQRGRLGRPKGTQEASKTTPK